MCVCVCVCVCVCPNITVHFVFLSNSKDTPGTSTGKWQALVLAAVVHTQRLQCGAVLLVKVEEMLVVGLVGFT